MALNFIRTKMNGRILVSLSATIMMLVLVDYDDAGTSEPEITDSPFGINTYGTVDVVSIAPYYEGIGVKMVRYWFDWANIEPEQGEFTWQQHGNDIDEQMIALRKANIGVLGLIGELKCSPQLNPDPKVTTGGTPLWARRSDCRDDIAGCPPADFSWYVDFARQVVKRYKPNGTLARQEGWGDNWGISHWEILNEPMFETEWNATREEYIELLKLTYEAIKKEDPDARVMNGGNIDFSEDISDLYDLGAKGYFDIFAFHVYGGYRARLKQVRELKKTMATFGIGNVPVWDTEGGGGGHEEITCQTEIRHFVGLIAEGVDKVFWFATKDLWIGSGLFKSESGDRTLGYYTYKLMTEKLEGSDWGNVKAIIEDENDYVYAYRFVRNGNSIYVAWWDYWEEETRESLADELRSTGFPDSLIGPIIEVICNAADAQEVAQKLGEIGLTGDQIGEVKSLYRKAGKAAILQDFKAKKTISLPVDFTGNALITHAVPDASEGADLDPDEYPSFFPTQIVPVVNGEITLQLGEDPVFLEPTTIHTDTMAPAKITDLAASDPKADSITLTWTAPGDDGDVGTATSYDIRYFTSPITEGNWAEATQCISEPIPRSAGSEEAFTVTGLQPGIIYYFAMKAQDEAGNTSEISNTVEIHLATPWDVNDDGVVNILDLIIVGKHFGEKPPKERKADVNGDGTVDILDLAVVAKHFGERGAMPDATITSARIAWERKETVQLRQGRVAEENLAAYRAGHSAGFS